MLASMDYFVTSVSLLIVLQSFSAGQTQWRLCELEGWQCQSVGWSTTFIKTEECQQLGLPCSKYPWHAEGELYIATYHIAPVTE